MSASENIKTYDRIRQNIAWLHDHDLVFPELLASNVLALDRIMSRLLKARSRYIGIIGDNAITIAEWEELVNLVEEISVILDKARAIYGPIKDQLGFMKIIGMKASNTYIKHRYLKDVDYHQLPVHGLDVYPESFFTINGPEAQQLLEFTIKLFNHGNKEPRQAGEVDVEVTAREISMLCRFLEPLILNPTAMHVEVPPILQQIREAGDRLRNRFKHVFNLVNMDFLQNEIASTKEGLERLLVKEAFTKQKEIKIETLFGTKKEYQFLVTLAAKLNSMDELVSVTP